MGKRRVPWSRVCPTWRRTHRPGSEEPSAGGGWVNTLHTSCLTPPPFHSLLFPIKRAGTRTLRGLTRESILPSSMSAISCRIPSRASQKRSISALSSDSVGSIIRVPATGQDMVGAWKPEPGQPVKFSSLLGKTSDVLTDHPTVVLQPLGHVDGFDVCRLLEGPHIQNELMGHKTCSDTLEKVNANSVD